MLNKLYSKRRDHYSTYAGNCTDRMSLLESLRKDHDERPVWLGSESQSNSKFSLFVNSKNGTWTFIQLIQDQACILANGGNSKILSAI